MRLARTPTLKRSLTARSTPATYTNTCTFFLNTAEPLLTVPARFVRISSKFN